MKKILFVILCMVCFVNAGIVTYTQSFDKVNVIKPAKSKQITCKTDANLNKGLIRNFACNVNSIGVYDEDYMWVGNLTKSLEAYYSMRYQDYDIDRYRFTGKHIIVEYESPTEDASEDNKKYVICPAGMMHKIEGNAYTCVKPYVCNNDEYAIDEFTCLSLPENAHRNNKIGYTCNKGFVNKNDACEKIVQCNNNDKYDKNENTCYEKPENSHWIKNTFEWECNENYVNQGDYCEEKVQCDSLSKYYAPSNTCISKPSYSHWENETSTNWYCNAGYIVFGNECIKKAECLSTQKYSSYSNSCIDPPEHAYWSNEEYYCEDGYVKGSYGCEVKKTCAHYDEENNECFTKPEHSHWVYADGATWECDANYHDNGNGECFTCEEPYQFNFETRTCVVKPEHSNWTYEGHWECEEGYVERYGSCEEKVSCWFSRYDERLNQCVSKPSGSHWVNDHSTDWEYDEPLNLSQYFSLNHWISFEFYGNNAKDLKDYTQYPIVMTLNYNVGPKVGNDDVNFTPFITGSLNIFGLNYTGAKQFSYDGDESITSMYFKLGIGAELCILEFFGNVAYNYIITQELDNIKFGSYVIDYKVGYNVNEHWLVYFMYEANLIKETIVLKNYRDNVMGLGVGYHF